MGDRDSTAGLLFLDFCSEEVDFGLTVVEERIFGSLTDENWKRPIFQRPALFSGGDAQRFNLGSRNVIPQQPLWEWLLNWLMNLVLRVEFSPMMESKESQDESHHEVIQSLSPCSSLESSPSSPHMTDKKAIPSGLVLCQCEEDPCRSGNCGIGSKCPSIISEPALHLVTELCKLGGVPIVVALLKYLPDCLQRIIIPAVNVHTETSHFHMLLANHEPRIPFTVCHSGPHFSLLKDWPSSLKIQLLQLDVGVDYLIYTGWAQAQLASYDEYAHGQHQMSDTPRDLSAGMRSRQPINDSEPTWVPSCKQPKASRKHLDHSHTSSERHCKASPPELFMENHEVGDQSSRIHGRKLLDVRTSLNHLCNTVDGECCQSDVDAEDHRGVPASCRSHVYVKLIDTLLKNAFWNYTPIQQSLAIQGGPEKQMHKQPAHRPLILPDPYFYHFYVAHKFYPDSFSPSIPTREFLHQPLNHKTGPDDQSVQKQRSLSWKSGETYVPCRSSLGRTGLAGKSLRLHLLH